MTAMAHFPAETWRAFIPRTFRGARGSNDPSPQGPRSRRIDRAAASPPSSLSGDDDDGGEDEDDETRAARKRWDDDARPVRGSRGGGASVSDRRSS